MSLSKPTNLLKIGPASKTLGVSIDTLRRWEKAGKIEAIRTPGGTRLFKIEQPLSLTSSEQTASFSTEDLLKEEEVSNISEEKYDIQNTKYKIPNTKWATKFLLGSAGILTVTLLITSWLTISYLSNPQDTQRFLKNNIASGFLKPFRTLAEGAVIIISPNEAKELGFIPPDEAPPPILGETIQKEQTVLGTTSASRFLEVNSDTQINGNLYVRDSINDLSLEGTPSASTITLSSGDTTLTVSNDATLDQDVSTTSAPEFTSLNLSETANQLIFQSGGPTGTLTWTPTAARIITLPDVTTTLVGIDNTQTLTNKTISGSSNTLTNIPNSALTNTKITVTAGTNLTGGGDITLGSSATIALKDSPSITGTLTVAGATTLSSTLAVNGVTYTYPSSQGAASALLQNNGSGTLTWATVGASGITADSLDFSEFIDNMTLDASTSIAMAGFNLTLTGSGNVGIGATTSSNKLDVWGNARITGTLGVDSTGTFGNGLFGYSGVTAPASGLAVSGNVGVGTTSPLGALHVVGQCVAEGTKIRRKRKGSRGKGEEDEWEEVPVEDIKPDDEILSLNDKSGEWEWHKVEKPWTWAYRKYSGWKRSPVNI